MARPDSTQGAALDPALTQKKRARRRLVGALVLGVAAAIALPLVLDSEPRQTITDVQIEIPPRDAPLPRAADDAAPAVPLAPSEEVAGASPGARDGVGAAAGVAPAANGGASASGAADATNSAPAQGANAGAGPSEGKPAEAKRADAESAGARRESASAATSAEQTPSGSAHKAETEAAERKLANAKPYASSSKTPASAPRSATADGSKAKSSAHGSHEAAAGGKFALQIGAYASASSVRAQSERVRKAGMRAYTEVVKTSSGTRTRVRVGPFPTREAAERARASLKLAGIDSAVVAQ